MVSGKSAVLFGLVGVCAVAPIFVVSAQATTLNGTVVAEDGKPVAGATVLLREYDGKGISDVTTLSDAQGKFTLTASDAPESVKARATYGTSLYAAAPSYAITSKSFKAGETIQLTLAPEQMLRGTVRDAAGKPVANAPVRLTDAWTGPMNRSENRIDIPPALRERYSTKTNAAGEWELRGVPTAVTNAWVMLDDPRFARRTYSFAQSSPAKPFAIVTAPASAITGKLVDAVGKPVADAMVAGVRNGNSTPPGYFDSTEAAKTDANGVFRLGQLGSGSFTVSVNALDKELVAPSLAGVVVGEGKTTALDAPIVLTSGSVITGSVIGKADKKPVPNVTIYVNNWNLPVGTMADGTFKLRVPPGINVVHIGSMNEGFAYFDPQQSVSVREGETKTLAPFELPPTIQVTLQVADESGKPVAGLPVRVYHHGWSDGTRPDDYAKTDAQGRWDSKNDTNTQLSGNDQNPWELLVPPDYEVVSPRTVTLPSATPIAVVVRKVDISAHPHGRVVTPDGKPISDAYVLVSSWLKDGNDQRDWQSQSNIATDVNGRFSLASLRPKSEFYLSIGKANYRLANPSALLGTVSEGKQPDFGDIVLIPLDATVSGVVVGTSGKPVVGAWVWSLDGSSRASARTDAKGAFTLENVPQKGEIALSLARGTATASYNLAKRTGNRLNLATPPTPLPLAIRTAQNRKHALALINELASAADVSQGVRAGNADADKLATLVAVFDLDTALKIGTGKDGKVSEGVLSEIMEQALPIAPDRVRTLYTANVKGWSSPWRTLWRSVDLAVVFAAKDPAFANACYETAKKQVNGRIPDDRLWEPLMVAKLAYFLHAPDADERIKQVLELATKERGDAVQGTLLVMQELASGDGVRAAKLMDTLPPGKRSEGAIAILTGMTMGRVSMANGDWTAQPLAAKRLWDGWFADGTIKTGDDRWRYSDSSQAMVRIVKAIAPTQPDAAYVLAKQAPQAPRWLALLWAATGQTDPALRVRRYREAVDDTPNGWGRAAHYTDAIRVATITGDTAFAAEMRAALAQSISQDQDAFNGNATDNAARATFAVGNVSPDMCLYYLEATMDEMRTNNPNPDSDIWRTRSALQAMALIDLPRALEIANGLHDTQSQTQGKMEIIRALLTPPAQQDALVSPTF